MVEVQINTRASTTLGNYSRAQVNQAVVFEALDEERHGFEGSRGTCIAMRWTWLVPLYTTLTRKTPGGLECDLLKGLGILGFVERSHVQLVFSLYWGEKTAW